MCLYIFPVITTDNVVNLTLLPPLWRISSINHDAENGRRRKMFATFSAEITNIDSPENDDKAEEAEAQEKMDVLWEDFNEELQSQSPVEFDSSDSESSDLGTYDPNQRNNRSEELETLEDCKLIPAKRKKLESVVMMMKKLFLLDNNAVIKRRSGSGSN